MNFLEQILHFEGTSSRPLHYYEKKKLNGDLKHDKDEVEHMIKDFEMPKIDKLGEWDE